MRHVIVLTLTSAFGLTFTFAIDFLTLFWLSQLDNQALKASVSIAGAVMFLSVSLSVAMMIATIPQVSRAIGRGDLDEARRAGTASIMIAVIILGLVALLAIAFLRPLLAGIGRGASAEAMEFARRFLLISLPSLPLMSIGMICAGILRAEGDGLRAMYVTLSAGLTAAALDPIFIIGFGLGNEGAAMVVFITRCVMAASGLYFVIGKYNLLAPMRNLALGRRLRPFALLAFPILLTQLSAPIGNVILTRFIAPFGDVALEAYAVNFRLLLVTFGSVFALSGAIGGIIGQNFGAGRLDRVKEAYIKAIQFGTIYTFIAWGLLLIARPYAETIFKLDSAGLPIVNAFVYTAWYFVFVSALYVSNAAFNNLGRPFWSTALNWTRDGLLTLPVGYAMTLAFGATGAVYTQAILGVLVGSIAGWIGWRYLDDIAEGRVAVDRAKR